MSDVVNGRVVLGWIPVNTTLPTRVEVPAMQGMTSLWPEGTFLPILTPCKDERFLAILGPVVNSEWFDLEWTQNLQRFLVENFDFKRNHNVT
jgi:hypothetical protein